MLHLEAALSAAACIHCSEGNTMIHTKKRLAAAALALTGLLAVGAPTASAADVDDLTFWSDATFTGQTVTYEEVEAGCTVLPFVVHAELNGTDTGIRVYESTDCTGHALTFPANDIHSFIRFDARSFEPVG